MKDEIFAIEQAAMERWRRGDPFGWTEISSEDVIYVEQNLTCPVVGLQNYIDYFKPAVGQIIYQGSEFINPVIELVGDAAVLSYNYRSTIQTPQGERISQLYWNTSEVYFKIKGKWKIVHSHWAYAPHHCPQRVEVPIPVNNSQPVTEGLLAELLRLETGAMARWRKGDPYGFIELYDPRGTYFDSGTLQRVDGFTAIEAELGRRKGTISYEGMDFIDPLLRVCGDLALLFYRFCDLHLNDDGLVTGRTPWNCTEVYAKRGDRWKILHTHWSLIQGQKG